MPKVTLAVCQPRVAATGAVTTVRLSGGGARGHAYQGTTEWLVGLQPLPPARSLLGYDELGPTGAATPGGRALTWQGEAADLDAIAALVWPGAEATVYEIEDDGTAQRTLFTGFVADARITRPGEARALVVDLVDAGLDFTKPVIDATFAGTGGVEGGAALAGRARRRAWGVCRNVELWAFDEANNIWVATDPNRPLNAILAVKDAGLAATGVVTVAWAGSVAATLAALAAVNLGNGAVNQAARAPSIGAVKWWRSDPVKLTADIEGETAGGYSNRPLAIAAAVVAARAPRIWTARFAPTSAARDFACGLLVEEQSETIAAALNRLLGGVSVWWALNALGEIDCGTWSWTLPTATLDGWSVERTATYRPHHTRKLGYAKNHHQHSKGEIAGVILAGDVAYSDGTPVDALKPAAAGATRNQTFRQVIDPATQVAVVDGALWTDTSVAPNVERKRVGGAWVAAANLTTEGTHVGVANDATRDINFSVSSTGGNVDVRGNRVTKTTGGDGWNVAAWSNDVLRRAARVSFRSPRTDQAAMVGISFSVAGADYTDTHAIYVYPGGGVQIYEGPTLRATLAASAGFDALTEFQICYDNDAIFFGRGGAIEHAYVVGPNLGARAKVNIHSGDGVIEDVRIEPHYQTRFDYMANSEIGGDGRATSGRLLKSNLNAGLRATTSAFPISDSWAAGTVTIDFAASTWFNDEGGSTFYSSASSAGHTPGVTRWWSKPDADFYDTLEDAAGYNGATSLVGALQLAETYIGVWTTRASSSGSGSGATGGGENCVDADAWVLMADGSERRARDVAAGDRIMVLNAAMVGLEAAEVEGNDLALEECVWIDMPDASVAVSMDTPLTTRIPCPVIVHAADGDVTLPYPTAANCHNYRLPVAGHNGHVDWVKPERRYAGRREVARIRCGQRTYGASVAHGGRKIFTHNPKP
jgi:hypothetical protein